jgi:hypothetical protein
MVSAPQAGEGEEDRSHADRDLASNYPLSDPDLRNRSQPTPSPACGEGWGGGSSASGLFKTLWFDAGCARHPGGVSATRGTTGKIRGRRVPFVSRETGGPESLRLLSLWTGPHPDPPPHAGEGEEDGDQAGILPLSLPLSLWRRRETNLYFCVSRETISRETFR